MSDNLTVCMSRMALVAAVDAMLRHIVDYDFTTCHNLESFNVECGSELCAADMEFLRVAREHGISIEERLSAVRPGRD